MIAYKSTYWSPLWAAVLLVSLSCVHALAASDDVKATVEALAPALESEDIRAVAALYADDASRGGEQLWRRWSSIFSAYDSLAVELEVRLLGEASGRALARCAYTVSGRAAGDPRGPVHLVSEATVDVPLQQRNGQWRLGPVEWPRPDAQRQVARLLAAAGDLPERTVVHMALEMQGGEWWPIRHLVWAGDIGGASPVSTPANATEAIAQLLRQREALKQPGVIHLFVPKQAEGWGAVSGVWRGTPEGAEMEQQLRAQTARVEAAFGDSTEHVRLGQLLFEAGSYALAVEEYEKARALDPSADTEGGLQQALRALQRQERLRQWQEQLNAQRADELASEGGRLAQDRSALNARKPPQLLVSEQAVVRHHPREPMLTSVMAAIEEAHRTAITVFGFPMERVSVSVFASKQEYQGFRQWRGEPAVPEWSGGTSGVDGILTYSHTGVLKSIAHEYGHEAVHQFVLDAQVPVWLDEGIATIMEGAFADHLQLTAQLYQRSGRSFFPIESLSGPWTRLPAEMAQYAYAQARGMVEYMLQRWGRERVLGVLRDLRRGASYDEAFVRNVGITQAAFQQDWAQYTLLHTPAIRGRRARTPAPPAR